MLLRVTFCRYEESLTCAQHNHAGAAIANNEENYSAASPGGHTHDEEDDFQDDSPNLCDVTESQLINKGGITIVWSNKVKN